MIIPKFFQILGMFLLVEGLYLGILKHSMNMELICVGIGIAIFYAGRWLEGRKG